ncbi:MAG TPA: type II toxin-antitoxin system Phd/YefM family antitoxin [Trueperaceae bacterium]|nr:type II toxin-antitoxin system Phd/YefM family antitoxin [Trueperaceae bacterium]
MSKIDVSKARTNLAQILDSARSEPVLIERYGKPAGVLISPARHDELLAALDELADLRAFDEAMAEEGENIPWEQVKADLGWA